MVRVISIQKKNFLEKEMKHINENSWAWDTVVLIEAKKKGYRIKEMPIKWTENKESSHSSSFKRLLSDFLIHGKVILKLFAKWNLKMKINL
mgnify:CR=1 FL=1